MGFDEEYLELRRLVELVKEAIESHDPDDGVQGFYQQIRDVFK